VTILATSRERLHLKGEEPVPVEGLQVPEEDLIAKTQDYSAVQLFLDGARRVRSGIDLAVADIPYVIQLCRLVEGMPLAIELMVDWVGELSCAEIVQEIERGLLMTGQPLEVGRQPGLQVVFDRSWRLLTPKDQEVFRRLSVFRGGFDQEAAEQVAGAMRLQLATLVRKSLLRRNGGGRYDMHEVIRQYAHDRLQEAGETDEIEDRHLEYYLTWTEHAHAHLSGAQQLAWTARFEAEHDNLRAALARSQATVRNVDSGLQLAANLLLFWYFRGHWYEGRRWAEGMLRRAGASGHRMARGGNLLIVGTFAWLQGDFTAAYAPLEESVQLLQATGDAKALAFAKASLGYAKMFEGDNGSAYKHFEESAVLSRKLGDDWRLGLAVNGLGDAALRQGDYLRAREHLIEALKLSQKFEKTSAAAHVLNSLGKLDLLQGDYELAHAHLTESVALGQMNDNKRFTAMALCNLGRVEHRRGNYDQAVRRYRESLRLYKEVGEKSGIAECFEGLAGVAGSQGEPEHAARLYGAAEALRDRIGVPIPPVDRFEYDRNVASARAQLDEATWLALWNGGRGMSLE
jgi:predicted ATPase/Flp pilus assembly protein TadD